MRRWKPLLALVLAAGMVAVPAAASSAAPARTAATSVSGPVAVAGGSTLTTAHADGARRRVSGVRGASLAALAGRRTPVVPLFVVGFLLAIGLTSLGVLPAGVLTAAKHLQEVLLVAALVGLGTGIQGSILRRTGGRALLLGLVSWLLVAGTAYVGVRLVA